MIETLQIGVAPGRLIHERPRFVQALQRVAPVQLVPVEVAPERGLSGLIALGDVPIDPAQRGGLPMLRLETEQPSPVRTQGVHLVGASIGAALRGRVLRDDRVDGVRLQGLLGGERVLAEVAGTPVWVGTDEAGDVERAPFVPRELGPAESIRDLFLEGEFMALLPVLEFLRRVARDARWVEPALRAAFVIDDPNLRRPTYGHLRFADLVTHARKHGYHAVMATIPIDSRFANRGVAELFVQNADVLSLVSHGSAHYGAELREGMGMPRARQAAAEAVAAGRKLADRYGLDVGPVMVAPHESFGSESLVALAEAGFYARCSALGTRHSTLPCANWFPAEWGRTPLPSIPRRPLGSSSGELALRAHLGQPIILAGHHTDLRDGLGPLATAAAEIGRLGEVEWMSLSRIARSNFATRRRRDLLEIRLYSRNVEITVPEGVTRLRIEPPELAGESSERLRVSGAAEGEGPLDVPLELDTQSGRITVELRRNAVDVLRARRVFGPHVVARRALTEARDRLVGLA